MTSMTLTRSPARRAGRRPRARLVTGALGLVFLSMAATLTSFYLLLSVTPMLVSAGGGSGAGLAAGALMLAGVAAELAAPALIRRHGSRAVLGVGAVLLGAPALVLLGSGGLVTVVAVSLVRGAGFGLTAVVTGALVAELVPPGRRGEGVGLSGVVACAPAVVALPAGVWLAGHAGYQVVIVLAAATALCTLAALPGLAGPSGQPRAAGGGAARQLRGQRHGGMLRLLVVFAATTVSAGVVVVFLPLAAGGSGTVAAAGLLVQAVAAAAGRWLGGRAGDRRGHARLLAPGLAGVAAGMAALTWIGSPVAVIAGMCVFGSGFGIIQSATFALMIDRMPASGYGTASALWNLAYDAGYGAGPLVLGVVAAHTGYPPCFALTAALCLAALPLCARRHGRPAAG